MPKKRLSTLRPSTPTESIPTTFTDNLPLPALIVFDLDYTLWPFWVDTHVSPPLKPSPQSNHQHMIDRYGEKYSFYTDVPTILSAAHQHNIQISLASRTHRPDLAETMLRGLHIPQPSSSAPTDETNRTQQPPSETSPRRALDYFQYRQIYPGSKTKHFRKIQQETKAAGKEIAFVDMLFFDDEGRNRDVETELGVTFHLVEDGVSRDEIDRGVWRWRKHRGISRNGAVAYSAKSE